MYADDTAIMANTENELQLALNNLEIYCKQWKLHVNTDKTKIMIFGKRRYKKKFDFMLNGEVLEHVDSFKYLGVTFKFNCNFDVCKKISGIRQQGQCSLYLVKAVA